MNIDVIQGFLPLTYRFSKYINQEKLYKEKSEKAKLITVEHYNTNRFEPYSFDRPISKIVNFD